MGEHLLFSVPGMTLALPVAAVAEVVLRPRLARLPASAPAVEGVMALRGLAVPVLGLAGLLGLPEWRPDAFSPVLVMRDAAVAWAALVIRALAVAPLPGPLRPPHEVSLEGCVAGVVEGSDELIPDELIPGGLIHVLAPERLFSLRERTLLAQLAGLAARRLEALSP